MITDALQTTPRVGTVTVVAGRWYSRWRKWRRRNIPRRKRWNFIFRGHRYLGKTSGREKLIFEFIQKIPQKMIFCGIKSSRIHFFFFPKADTPFVETPAIRFDDSRRESKSIRREKKFARVSLDQEVIKFPEGRRKRYSQQEKRLGARFTSTATDPEIWCATVELLLVLTKL